MLELYKDFYCFYILKNLQQTYNGSTEMLEVGVDIATALEALEQLHWKRYLVENCHFIEKPNSYNY